MPLEMVPIAVLAFAALAQTFLMITANRSARYWRERYFAEVAKESDLIKRISAQRDEVLAGWNKTIADFNLSTAEQAAFRERMERLVGIRPA